jgi:superfamily II DNA/RNA helicase
VSINTEIPTSFSDLPLNPLIHKALEACGYTAPTPIQAKAIPVVLAGKDLVACAQTGTGKTAAFVLPALNYLAEQEPIQKPRILILTPTRELATQINTAASKYGKFMRYNIVSLVGGMSYDPQIRDLKRGADIIVATPGRLIDHMENKRVDLSHVDMLILDEADRMLDMGFIDDVEIIAGQTPKTRQTLMFSATVDKKLVTIVRRLLKDPVQIDLSVQSIDAPKIKQTLYKAKNMHHKSRMLKHFLNDENIYKAIIFSATKSNADRLAQELRDDGFAAAPLHGDLRQNVRNRTIEALRRGKIQFLVATDVAARGLDISDITHVINYDLPKFSEDYVHRIGRTGRAGKTGEAISFFTNTDMRNLQSIERYIGKRLTIQSDNFVYAETSTNSRSDAEKFPPNAMMESNDRGGNRGRGRQQGSSNRRFNDSGRPSFGDKPRRSFDRDESRSSRPEGERRSFDRDQPRDAKPFGEKRSFGGDKSESGYKPRSFDKSESGYKPRSFDGDAPRSAKPFGEKRSFGNDRSESSDRPRRSFNRDEQPRSGKPFGEKRSFGNDRSESSDRPRRSFNRDEQPRSGKPFGEKRSFGNDRSESSDRPRRSFNSDAPRSGKPFGEKRSFNSDRPSFGDKPRRTFTRDASAPSADRKPRGRSDEGRTNVFERPVYEFEARDENPRVRYKKRVDNTDDSRRSEKPARPKFAGKPRSSEVKKGPGRSALGGKNTKKPFRDAK